MKKIHFLSFLAIAAFAFLAGCESKQADNSTASDVSKSSEHVHADGATHNHHEVGGHSHGAGPHGGIVADWGGGKFHVELTVDHEQQKATVYILGADEKTATPIDADEVMLTLKDPPLAVTLKPSPQEQDTEGMSSRFVGNHESLGVEKHYEGSLSAVVSETPYSGNFKEGEHEH